MVGFDERISSETDFGHGPEILAIRGRRFARDPGVHAKEVGPIQPEFAGIGRSRTEIAILPDFAEHALDCHD